MSTICAFCSVADLIDTKQTAVGWARTLAGLASPAQCVAAAARGGGLADLHLVIEIEITRLDLLLLFLGKQLFDALSVFVVVRLF